MRTNKGDFNFAIQQCQFAAKMTNRIHLGLVGRITQVFHHRVGQIECGHQFRPGFFPDLHRVTDMIRMSVRNENEIDMLERGNFLPSHFRKQDSIATDQ